MWSSRVGGRWFWAAAAGVALAAGCASRGAFLPSEQSVPAIPSSLAHDLGRRAPGAPVLVQIVLRFRNEDALERLVDDLSDPDSPRFRHYLTPAEFAARYAPAPQQQARVAGALRAAGFRNVRTSADRSEIEARAPAATAQRFFETEIHDFDEGRYGRRYANVSPLQIPAALQSSIDAVELNSIVFASEADAADGAGTRTDVIQNGGFEQRKAHWTDCNSPQISTRHPFAGTYDLLLGSKSPAGGNADGLQAVCQRVTVPQRAVLGVHAFGATNVTQLSQGYQEIGLMSSPGTVVAVLRKNLNDRRHWEFASYDLRAYAGRRLYLFFGVFGRAQKSLYDSLYVDDVTLTGTPVSPSPTPGTSPTPVGPGPGKPLTGPTYGPSSGWAPRAVADGFDFPVQHGYDGRTASVAVIVPSSIDTADLIAFLSENGIRRHGKLVQTGVDGGPNGGDPTEAMIEIEAIAALAPGADITVYETPDLSNISVLDAYRAAIIDNSASIVNASFGECDFADPAFDEAIEKHALHAAALGITFVAASGDTGSACYDPSKSKNKIGVNVPAAAPHVLGVGGTESLSGRLTATPCPCPISTPVAWDDHNVNFGGLSGGGVSRHWAIPPYQRGVLGHPASASRRNVPDLAFPAVDDDVRVNGADELVDGTSWSSAVASALLAETVEICGYRLGFAQTALYATYARTPGLFFDPVAGSNGGYVPALPRGYSAASGYDDVTGIGMPYGFRFAVAMCGKSS